jgi:hypothetical protein
VFIIDIADQVERSLENNVHQLLLPLLLLPP